MSDPEQTRIRWASRVSRDEIRRLYESDARGMLDEELLDEVGYGIYARCCEMFEVLEAKNGRIKCRNCSVIIQHRVRWGKRGKKDLVRCGKCGWQITWGRYYDCYTGRRLQPGAATQVFRDFVERWPQTRTASAKMLLIDWLIHEFHMNQGIAGRPVGENVIQGDRQQVSELIASLAYGPGSTEGVRDPQGWAAEHDDPIRLFRRAHAWAEIVAIAAELGIQGCSRMREDELVTAIHCIAPERFGSG